MSFQFEDFLYAFMSIVLEAMPFIVIGALVSGILEEFLPQTFFTRILPKRKLPAIMLCSLMGFLLPMCECGIVPVMRRLLSKGVPASCAIAYMLSAPVINPIVLASTGMAFWGFYDFAGVPGGGMVLLRGGLSFIVAVSAGLLIERLVTRGVPIVRDTITRVRLNETERTTAVLEEDTLDPQVELVPPAHVHDEHCDHSHDHDHGHAYDHGHAHDHGHHHHHGPRTLLDRLTAVADIAIGDFLDIAAFLIIGAALAAGFSTALPVTQMEKLADFEAGSILAMMGFSFLLSLCSEADAFVAANLRTFSIGSKLAFLVLGPMLDIKLLIMYRWVFTGRMLKALLPMIVVLIFALSWLVDIVNNLLPASG